MGRGGCRICANQGECKGHCASPYASGVVSYTIELEDGFQRDAPERELRAAKWGTGLKGFMIPNKAKPRGAPLSKHERAENAKKQAAKEAKEAARAKKVKAGRCAAEGCRKKLKLTAISCACGFRFCPDHRSPEQHDCEVDFKKKEKARLEEEN